MGTRADADLYSRDFYAWTEDQAARLHALAGDNRFDAQHVAEEIEDLGAQQLRAVESHLAQTVAHLVKAAWIEQPDLVKTWRETIAAHQDEACHAATPRIRQKLDLGGIWRRGVRLANKSFRTHGEPELADTPHCPFTLDELLAESFDIDAALRRVAEVLPADDTA